MTDYAIAEGLGKIADAIGTHAKSMTQIADAISRHADATLAASSNATASHRYAASSANSALDQRKLI